MPNIKSAIKRVEIARRRTLRNAAVKSALKTYTKRFLRAASEANKEKAHEELRQAVKRIDQAAAKGVLHRNTAARKKARLQRIFNRLA